MTSADNSCRVYRPTDGSLVGEYAYLNGCDAQDVLEATATIQRYWKRSTVDVRQQCFHNLAELLKSERSQLATIITDEVGKLFRESEAEILKCADCASYYADRLPELSEPHPLGQDGRLGMVVHEPLGVILGIMPFNFPFWQVIRSAVPIIAAGNGYLLKHAPQNQGTGRAIEDLFIRAGFPKGLFSNINIPVDYVAEVIASPYIAGVTLTGSTRAGAAVAKAAGQAIKPVVLELGGSDPFIVLPDADLDHVVQMAVKARMVNNGQSCIASKRFIIAKELYKSFEEALIKAYADLKIGDVYAPETTNGPLARVDLAQKLADQVDMATKHGATYHGKRYQPADGAWYHPGILTNLTTDNPVNQEELFGPVAMLFEAANFEDMVRIANSTNYGLGATIWTKDEKLAMALAKRLEVGMVYVNQLMISTYEVPFGGIKQSGFGRELASDGYYAFTNKKSIKTA